MGTNAWPFADIQALTGVATLVLDEPGGRSWWEAAEPLDEVDLKGTFFQVAPCQFEHERQTNVVHVSSWDGCLLEHDAGHIRLCLDDQEDFGAEGSLIHLRGRMLVNPDIDRMSAVLGLGGHELAVDLSEAFREEVHALGHAAETTGRVYDVWGYFFAKTYDAPLTNAHFTAVLCVPAAHE